MSENQNIEWKESWRDEYLKWICGFANAQVGKIYIGINDSGQILGVSNSKKMLEDIPNKVQNTMGIIVDVNLLESDGRSYIEIIVAPSDFPINYKGEYHYRTGSTKQLLTGQALTQFFIRKTGFKWDSVLVDSVSVDDLDKESFDIFRREAKRTKRMTEEDLNLSNEELLNHLELIENGKLKRAAVLLFHRNPEKWFTGTYTKIGKFTGSEIDYMDEVHGSLMLQADRVIDLIYLKYLKASITYDKDVRVETYPFARTAIREAVFNALCHSNWGDCIPIQIRIEEKQMLISNSSVFPENWTAETLMADHKSVPYNPDIANTFYRAGYIESWGRGTKKICDACDESGATRPEYILHGGDVMVKFKALESAIVTASKVPKHQNDALDDALEKRFLSLLHENPELTQQEIELQLSVSRATIQRLTKKLIERGTLIRKGGKRYGYWEIHDVK